MSAAWWDKTKAAISESIDAFFGDPSTSKEQP